MTYRSLILLKKGAATDVNGRFSIVVRPGKYTVGFNCMGMESRQNYLEVYSGGELSISMEKSLIPLNEVVIKANRYHNVRGTQMGVDRLNYKVMKEVPVVMDKITYGGNAILYNLDRGTVELYGPLSLRVPVEFGIDHGIETAVYLPTWSISLAGR